MISQPTQMNPSLVHNSSSIDQNKQDSCTVPWYKSRTCKVVMVGLGLLAGGGAAVAGTAGLFGLAIALGAVALVCVGTPLVQMLSDNNPFAQKKASSQRPTPSEPPPPNLPVIPGAKVQWRKYIHNDQVKADMQRYDQFFAEHVKHDPSEIPTEAKNQLCNKLEGKTVDVITQNGTQRITLGKWGQRSSSCSSKRFYDMGDGLQLATCVGAHQHYDDLMRHRYMDALGVPSNDIQPAVVRWEYDGVQYTRATYIEPTHDSLNAKGIIVLNGKDYDANQQQLKGRRPLSKELDPFTLKNWDTVLKPLLKDVETLARNGEPLESLEVHAILVEKGSRLHSGGPDAYEARAFPFDLSSKDRPLKGLTVQPPLDIERHERLLKDYITLIVEAQYGCEPLGSPLPDFQLERLVDQLTERYKPARK